MKKYSLVLCAVIALSACSQETKQSLGLVNTAPDEFAVVTRAPLSVPPDYTLRPPRPGVARPMELSTQDDARQTVFGVSDVKVVNGSDQASDEFLKKAGADNIAPDIRQVVDTETAAGAGSNQTTADKLKFWQDSKAADAKGNPIDPNDEYSRLKQEGLVAVHKRNEDIPAP